MYDEINYELHPRGQAVMIQGGNKNVENAPSEPVKRNRRSTQKKLIIGTVVGVIIIGASAVGIALSVKGRLYLL